MTDDDAFFWPDALHKQPSSSLLSTACLLSHENSRDSVPLSQATTFSLHFLMTITSFLMTITFVVAVILWYFSQGSLFSSSSSTCSSYTCTWVEISVSLLPHLWSENCTIICWLWTNTQGVYMLLGTCFWMRSLFLGRHHHHRCHLNRESKNILSTSQSMTVLMEGSLFVLLSLPLFLPLSFSFSSWSDLSRHSRLFTFLWRKE